MESAGARTGAASDSHGCEPTQPPPAGCRQGRKRGTGSSALPAPLPEVPASPVGGLPPPGAPRGFPQPARRQTGLHRSLPFQHLPGPFHVEPEGSSQASFRAPKVRSPTGLGAGSRRPDRKPPGASNPRHDSSDPRQRPAGSECLSHLVAIRMANSPTAAPRDRANARTGRTLRAPRPPQLRFHVKPQRNPRPWVPRLVRDACLQVPRPRPSTARRGATDASAPISPPMRRAAPAALANRLPRPQPREGCTATASP